MILIKDIWDRVQDYAKKDQSGMDTVFDFNGKVNEAQLDLISSLCPFYDDNDRVNALLDPMIKEESVNVVNGSVNKPVDCYLPISVRVDVSGKRFAAYQVKKRELDLLYKIKQREPSLDKERVYWHTMGDAIKVHPQENLSVGVTYASYPKPASLAMLYSEVDGEIVQQVDVGNTVNLNWDVNVTNIIVLMVLSKYGISNRELILEEYARLGIQLEISKQL